MALRNYALSTVRLTHATTPIDFRQVNQRTISPGVSTILNQAAGSYAPGYAAISDVNPSIDLQSSELQRWMQAVSILAGLGFKASMTYTGCEAYYAQKESHATRYSGSNHLRVSFASGMVLPQSLEAKNDGEAMINVKIIGVSDNGVTSPITHTDAVALPTTVYPDQKFTLGPIKFGSTLFDGISEMNLAFGLEASTFKEKGLTYQQFPTISKSAPVLTFKASNMELPITYGPSGALPASALTVFLRRYQTSSVVYSDASAQHISLVIPANQYVIFPTEGQGSDYNNAMQGYTVQILEGSSAAITAAFNQVIS